MLDKVDPLLQIRQLHQCAELFLRSVEDDFHLLFSLAVFLSVPVLAKVKLGHKLVQVKPIVCGFELL